MKRLFLSAALIITGLTSCQKGEKIDPPGWVALSFTSNPSSNYLLYMNDPHVNLTLPPLINSQNVSFTNGMCYLNGNTYVMVGHNWGEIEVILYIFRNGTLEREIRVAPLKDIEGAHDNQIKRFNLSFDASPGEYTFSAASSYNGEITPLYTHTLHGTQNRMVVR